MRSLLKRVRSAWWCLTRRCSYYSLYLLLGDAVLPHNLYHIAECMAQDHFNNCTWPGTNPCPDCMKYAEVIRA